ncbi:hypothetical protein ABPG74_019643 [Tetrahymena malaccensis]
MIDSLDIFGSQIFLRFNKQQTYSTRLGSYFTLIIYLLIFFRLFGLLVDVIQRSNPEVIYNDRQVDDPAIFQASSKTFPIAFGMENPYDFNHFIDESIYTVTAFWNYKIQTFNETTQQYVSTWNQMSINVQPCNIENFQNPDNQKYYLNLNYTNMYCLPPDYELAIQEILDNFLQKSNFGVQLSDSYVDPTISENPFKVYSRDMFWSTSTQLPKDVYVYIRNNYVYSDFGWFFSDVTTQRFPSYSFYESFEYPPSFQDYFLTVYFRFEKQKEGVYKRSYKRFNSILSEIGGFTQTFLAIGYMLCKKVSQTKLDIDLINKAFKFQDNLKNVLQKGQEQQQKEEEEVNKSLYEQPQHGKKKKSKQQNKQYQNQEKKQNSKEFCFSSSDENLRKSYSVTKKKLKRLIFDQDQLKLFDYLPKPTIQTDMAFQQNNPKQNREIDLLYQDNRSELQKACESFQAYQNISSKSDQSTLDRKLVNQLDPVLKQMFNQLKEKQTISKNQIQLSDENKITSCQHLTPSMRQSIYLSNQNLQNNSPKAEKDKNSFRLLLNPQLSSKSNPTTFRLNQFEQQLNAVKDNLPKQQNNQNQQFINKTESQIEEDEFEEIDQENKKKQLNAFRSNLNQLSQL